MMFLLLLRLNLLISNCLVCKITLTNLSLKIVYNGVRVLPLVVLILVIQVFQDFMILLCLLILCLSIQIV